MVVPSHFVLAIDPKHLSDVNGRLVKATHAVRIRKRFVMKNVCFIVQFPAVGFYRNGVC